MIIFLCLTSLGLTSIFNVHIYTAEIRLHSIKFVCCPTGKGLKGLPRCWVFILQLLNGFIHLVSMQL